MAPERRDNPASASVRADVYALGLVLRQMIPPSRDLRREVGKIDEIIRIATAPNPAIRYHGNSGANSILVPAIAQFPSRSRIAGTCTWSDL